MGDEPAQDKQPSGWEQHEREQRERLAKLSLREKIQWLEEAQRVVEHLKAQGRRSTDTSDGEGS